MYPGGGKKERKEGPASQEPRTKPCRLDMVVGLPPHSASQAAQQSFGGILPSGPSVSFRHLSWSSSYPAPLLALASPTGVVTPAGGGTHSQSAGIPLTILYMGQYGHRCLVMGLWAIEHLPSSSAICPDELGGEPDALGEPSHVDLRHSELASSSTAKSPWLRPRASVLPAGCPDLAMWYSIQCLTHDLGGKETVPSSQATLLQPQLPPALTLGRASWMLQNADTGPPPTKVECFATLSGFYFDSIHAASLHVRRRHSLPSWNRLATRQSPMEPPSCLSTRLDQTACLPACMATERFGCVASLSWHRRRDANAISSGSDAPPPRLLSWLSFPSANDSSYKL
ncbi:hypothetical protein LZ30DRAFT_691911 [Colletotrichum cereale]|nr:hypothetical protein LZ30DRAFT_691911 [Colletotrichum cereale]